MAVCTAVTSYNSLSIVVRDERSVPNVPQDNYDFSSQMCYIIFYFLRFNSFNSFPSSLHTCSNLFGRSDSNVNLCLSYIFRGAFLSSAIIIVFSYLWSLTSFYSLNNYNAFANYTRTELLNYHRLTAFPWQIVRIYILARFLGNFLTM